MISRGASVPLLLALVLALAGCTGDGDGASRSRSTSTPSPSTSPSAGLSSDCTAVVGRVVTATQQYVDTYGAQVTGASAGGASATPPDLQKVLQQAQQDVQRLGCPGGELEPALTSGLEGVTARGPLALAVRAQLVASLTGKVGSAPEDRTLAAGEQLADVLPTLAAGSTVVLPAGTVRLDQPIVLLQGVILRGAGVGRTVVRSSASDAAFLVLTDGRVAMRGLSVRHTGRQPASLVVGGPSSSIALTSVELSGARMLKGPTTRGGSGVLMSARDKEASGRGTTLEVTDGRFTDNQAGGVLLTGGHRASIVRSRFQGNGQCGVCFLDSATGTVARSTLTGGGVGVLASGTAAPLVRDDVFRGQQIGFQAVGRATPEVRDVRVADPQRAAMLFGDHARGRVTGAVCEGARPLIVVARTALPFVGRNRCQVVPGS